jgi:hypothetical protein
VRGGFGPIVLVVVIAACGDSSSPDHGEDALPATGTDGTSQDGDAGLLERSSPGPAADDTDGDGVPDAEDCDPSSTSLKKRILQDDLSSDKGLFAAAMGFPAASWSFADVAAYNQTRLADASDVSLYTKDAAIGDVQIDVTAASTEISGTITPRLRQIFVVVGAVSNGGALTAVGCGIEVAQAETPELKTSIVKLSGPSANVVTTVLQRVTRPPVNTNEELAIRLRFEDGAMICDVTQAGGTTTTATADGLGALTGSVGFFTRQTKALFKNARVCALK